MIVSDIAPQQFLEMVKAGYEAVRQGDLLALGQSPLADLPLVTACMLSESAPLMERGRVLRTILLWGMMQLQPGGVPDWNNRRWLDYNILHHYYWQGARLADVAEWSGYSDIHVSQSLRPRALEQVTAVLRHETNHPHQLETRRGMVVADLVSLLPETGQYLLWYIAALAVPVPMPLLHQLDLVQMSLMLAQLRQHHLVQADEAFVAVNPLVQTYAQWQEPPSQQAKWLALGATFFVERGQVLTAVAIHHRAQTYQQGVALLQASWKEVVDTGDGEAIAQLQTLLSRYLQTKLPYSRPLLTTIAGQVAEFMGELGEANRYYQETMSAQEPQTKAFALYRLAELAKRQAHMDLALVYYARAIEVLTAVEPANLLPRLYIDRAMIYIQERQNLPLAQQDLTQATALVALSALSLKADLHNAWASYWYRMEDPARALGERLQAWLAALEAQDHERMTKTAHNLGQAYAWQKQFSEALVHLQKSLQLAEEAGNQQMVASNHKTIGNTYFLQANYAQAESHYQQAYQLFVQMENQNWQGYLCYDLAELYATTYQWAEAEQYLKQGQAFAETLGNRMLASGLQTLALQFPTAGHDLNERQAVALRYVAEHGAITNKQYCELTRCSPITAVRDLKECLEKEVLVKVGKGRGTRYVLQTHE